MKALLLLIFPFFFVTAFAQTDSTETFDSATYTSLISLSRTDIERLPATGFMELVQGAFPFVGSVSTVEEDYAFVTEGFVAINPNAINLSQIESIRFYPAGTALTRGSLGKKGTFVIRVRPGKNGFDFSTKTGLLLTTDNRTSNNTSFQYESGLASLNELSYRRRTDRSFFSTALSYLRSNNPYLQVLSAASKLSSRSHAERIR